VYVTVPDVPQSEYAGMTKSFEKVTGEQSSAQLHAFWETHE
jgi:hypothetical protein